jgi:4-alpha-glucanotransferase
MNCPAPETSEKLSSLPFHHQSGILLHPTSLPGPYGMGEIGAEAVRWLETVARMGQSLWQILPLGPTGYGDSPYQTSSTYAANPLLISFSTLREWGLLLDSELADFPDFDPRSIDYGPVIEARKAILRSVTGNFADRATPELLEEFQAFLEAQSSWLDDYALFVALKDAHEGRPWTLWEPPLRDRDPGALEGVWKQHESLIQSVRIRQFLFDRQWTAIRAKARDLGIRLIGDIPIFVSHDSSDVWANRALFHLYPDGNPVVVAGVPPDYFSATGQRWGNPLYNWDRHREQSFSWWTSRVARMLDWVDVVRVDHFRGFVAYWEIPAEEPTAVRGEWVGAPGRELMAALKRDLGGIPVIAEDLGVITEEVDAFREDLHLPGMRVVQFDIMDDRPGRLPEDYSVDTVAYSGTHDNETLQGWFENRHTVPPKEGTPPDLLQEYGRIERFLRGDLLPFHWRAMEEMLKCPACAVVFPLQDLLGLGAEGRMNTPGNAGGNWKWRFAWEDLTEGTVEKMAEITARAGRNSMDSRK